MQLVEPDNARYLLELERNSLLQEQAEFQQVYGQFSLAFLTSVQVLALLAYLFIFSTLLYYKNTRTKTNFIVVIWALINYIVLLENFLTVFTKWNVIVISDDVDHIAEMLATLGRSYGTVLAIIWIYSKYCERPSPKCDILMYLIMAGPAALFAFFFWYYFNSFKYIYEVYGPSCDVAHVVVYIVVAFIFIFGKMCASTERSISHYTLLLSLVNLLTNFPISLATIYLRFNLDISYTYMFDIHLIDFALKLVQYSAAFIVLFLVVHYNDCLKLNLLRRPTKHIV